MNNDNDLLKKYKRIKNKDVYILFRTIKRIERIKKIFDLK
jgi:hypothetical protein